MKNGLNQFFDQGGVFFSSPKEMNGSKHHYIDPFTPSAWFNNLVLTLVDYHTTLLIENRGGFEAILHAVWEGK